MDFEHLLHIFQAMYGFEDANVVVMRDGVDNSIYEPTRENIVRQFCGQVRWSATLIHGSFQIREIRQFVKGAIAGDQYVFHCMHHNRPSLQVSYKLISSQTRAIPHRSQIGPDLNRTEWTKACLLIPFHRAHHIDVLSSHCPKRCSGHH
jgi:hypothetical protein